MTTLLKNSSNLEIFLNSQIELKNYSYFNKKPFKFSHANRAELKTLSSAVKTDLETNEVFEEVKSELQSPELEFSPQIGTIQNLNRMMRRFNDLVNSFKTQKAKAKIFIEDQKFRVEDAYEDLKSRLKEHFNVKYLFQVPVKVN